MVEPSCDSCRNQRGTLGQLRTMSICSNCFRNFSFNRASLIWELSEDEDYDNGTLSQIIGASLGVDPHETLAYTRAFSNEEEVSNHIAQDMRKECSRGTDLLVVKVLSFSDVLLESFQSLIDEYRVRIFVNSSGSNASGFSCVIGQDFSVIRNSIERMAMRGFILVSSNKLAGEMEQDETTVKRMLRDAEAAGVIRGFNFSYSGGHHSEVFSPRFDFGYDCVYSVLQCLKRSKLRAYVHRIKSILEEVFEINKSEQEIVRVLNTVRIGSVSVDSNGVQEFQLHCRVDFPGVRNIIQLGYPGLIRSFLDRESHKPQGTYLRALYVLFSRNRSLRTPYLSEVYLIIEQLDNQSIEQLDNQSSEQPSNQSSEQLNASELRNIVTDIVSQFGEEGMDILQLRTFLQIPETSSRSFREVLSQIPEVIVRGENVIYTKNSEQEDECVICLEPMTDPFTISCGHNYHHQCIKDVFKRDLSNGVKVRCPECRNAFDRNYVDEVLLKRRELPERSKPPEPSGPPVPPELSRLSSLPASRAHRAQAHPERSSISLGHPIQPPPLIQAAPVRQPPVNQPNHQPNHQFHINNPSLLTPTLLPDGIPISQPVQPPPLLVQRNPNPIPSLSFSRNPQAIPNGAIDCPKCFKVSIQRSINPTQKCSNCQSFLCFRCNRLSEECSCPN